jgi:hypothetical protein
MKGMIVEVYSNSKPTTCDMIKEKSVLLCGSGIPEIFESEEGVPTIVIEERNISFMEEKYLTAYPVLNKVTMKGMFSGRFIWSSDSRFRRKYLYPIPLHDRFE